jgi:hypothetical protein
MAADVFMGHDENCLDWIRVNRDPGPETAAGGGRQRRERGQRRARRGE